METTDQTTTGAINEVLGAVEDVADDLSDFADTYDESAGGSTIETIGSGAKGSYGIGDLFVADDHFYYKAIAIISPGNILSIANCTKTDVRAELNTTNSALINKVSKFVGGGYVPVDAIAYDSTNKQLGLKVDGADTVIPFKKGGSTFAKATITHSGPAIPTACYDADNNLLYESGSVGDYNTGLRMKTPAFDTWYVGGGKVRIDTKVNCYIDNTLIQANTQFQSSYMYNSGHITEIVPVWN